MASFSYKSTTTTAMKVCGCYDADRKIIIDEDDVERSIATLLSEFDGAVIEINIKHKSEEEFDEPVPSEDEE